MRIMQTTSYQNNQYLQKQNNPIASVENYNNISFKGESAIFKPIKRVFEPIKNQYDRFTSFIAKGFAKILNIQKVENIILATSKDDHLKKYLVPHLTTASSIVLSGLYVNKTLHNDKLDADKKRTLAINQAGVWAVSTLLCYTLNMLVEKKTGDIISKFKLFNNTLNEAEIAHYTEGIKNAKSLMIFDIIYRYLTPVAVTPLATHIGNKIQEKKQAELNEGNKK